MALEFGFATMALELPRKIANVIFDQEFSRKPNGMGLGLFIARQVIEPYGKLVYCDDCKLPGGML